MSVYVDDMFIPYGRMLMSHMVADTEQELHNMADAIGVARRWYQKDHYDICKEKRATAISLGAVPVTKRELALMVGTRRTTGILGTLQDAKIELRHRARVRHRNTTQGCTR